MGERAPTLGLSPILPAIVLVLVILWALAAVLMLTGTLVNAREINDVVPLINNQVSPIDKDTDSVKLAVETARISGKIRVAAKPLVGQTERIIAVATNIDGNAARILVTAQAINENAKSINGTVRSINGKVTTINGNVVSINDTVGSIQGNALAINDTVGSIGTRVTAINAGVGSIFRGVGPVGATDDNSIKASTGRILGTFTRLRPETVKINTGVDGINRRAKRGILGVRSLKTDFAPISTFVGGGPFTHGTEGPGTIHGHANSIDCSNLIQSAGPTQFCGK